MQIKETPYVPNGGALDDDVVVLADSAGVALRAPRAFSPRVRNVRRDVDCGGTSRWVEIPLVNGDGEICGVLCQAVSGFDKLPAHRSQRIEATAEVAQFVAHDINNLFAVIGSGLRLLECQDDAAHREVIVGKMQEAITRGALLSRQLLDAAPLRRPGPINEFFDGNGFAAMASTLDRALHPDIVVHVEVAPDLWDFNADPEELYFALLNLCRNSADAMQNCGAITVAARNVECTADSRAEAVEIVVADGGEGMSEDVLAQALNPYFTTKAPGSGTGLGLAQVLRFAQGRGGTIGIESERGGGTVVRLLLPRVHAAGSASSTVAGEITYVPTPEGGIFHVVNTATRAPTS